MPPDIGAFACHPMINPLFRSPGFVIIVRGHAVRMRAVNQLAAQKTQVRQYASDVVQFSQPLVFV
jgi:hypothetical protein